MKRIKCTNSSFVDKIRKWQTVQISELTFSNIEQKYLNRISLDEYSMNEIINNIVLLRDYVNYKVRYKFDDSLYGKTERYSTINEIYKRRYGDCEDQSIILLYQFIRFGFSCDNIGCISIHRKNEINGHMCNFIEYTDDLLIIDNGWISKEPFLYSSIKKEWLIRGCFNFNEIWTY